MIDDVIDHIVVRGWWPPSRLHPGRSSRPERPADQDLLHHDRGFHVLGPALPGPR
jgi:hypothetical protein